MEYERVWSVWIFGMWIPKNEIVCRRPNRRRHLLVAITWTKTDSKVEHIRFGPFFFIAVPSSVASLIFLMLLNVITFKLVPVLADSHFSPHVCWKMGRNKKKEGNVYSHSQRTCTIAEPMYALWSPKNKCYSCYDTRALWHILFVDFFFLCRQTFVELSSTNCFGTL